MLTLAGDLTATSGARLGFLVAEGATPSILVGGTPALNGAHLDVAIADVANQRSTSFLALTAQKGPSVSNTDVTTSSSTIVPILKQDPNSLFVVLLDMPVPLAPVATKPNTAAAGAAIDRVKGNATGDLGAVVRELTALDDRALALEMVAGEIHASRLRLALIDSESFTDLVRTGLMDRTHERERAATGWGGQRLRWWGQLSGKRAKFDATHLSRGGIADLGAGAGGFDWRASDRWLFGGGGGFGAGSMNLNGLSGSTDYQAPRAFGYAGFRPGGFGLAGGGSAARASSNTKRRIVFAAVLPEELGATPLTGGIDREAESDETTLVSDQWGQYDDGLDVRSYTVDWLVGVRRSQFGRNGFTESGAGALSLRAADQVIALTQIDVKLHVWKNKGTFRPYVEALVRREMTDSRIDEVLELANTPTSDVVVQGLPRKATPSPAALVPHCSPIFGAFTLEYRFRRSPAQTRQSVDFRVRAQVDARSLRNCARRSAISLSSTSGSGGFVR
jgi:uncharacterized protein with beta-barrel porin domain